MQKQSLARPAVRGTRAAEKAENTQILFCHRPTPTKSDSYRSLKKHMGLAMPLDKQACPLAFESHMLRKLSLVRSPLRVEFERAHRKRNLKQSPPQLNGPASGVNSTGQAGSGSLETQRSRRRAACSKFKMGLDRQNGKRTCHLPADPHLLSKLPLFDSPLLGDFEQEGSTKKLHEACLTPAPLR